MPLGNYYVGGMNTDGIIKSAKYSWIQTGQDQMVHAHVFGVACNEDCQLISQILKEK